MDDKMKQLVGKILSMLDMLADEHGDKPTLDAALVASVFAFSTTGVTLGDHLDAVEAAWHVYAQHNITVSHRDMQCETCRELLDEPRPRPHRHEPAAGEPAAAALAEAAPDTN